MKSQNQEVLAHLRAGKSITAQQAIRYLRVYRLAARIADIRGLGYPIATEMIKRPSKRTGRIVSYARYHLEGL